MWLSALAKMSQAPARAEFDQDRAGDPRHVEVEHELVGGVEPARSAHPVQLAVEDEEPDEPEPEDRHRVADEAHDPHQLVGEPSRPGGGEDARRHPEGDAEERRQGGELERGGKDPLHVLDHRLAGQERLAEVAGRRVAHVDGELHPDRAVEAERLAGGGVLLGGGALADDGEDRVDGDDPADDEGDREEPEQRHGEGRREDPEPGEEAPRAREAILLDADVPGRHGAGSPTSSFPRRPPS